MTKKYPRSSAEVNEEAAYVSFDGDVVPAERVKAFEEMSKAVAEYQAVARYNDYSSLQPGVSGRPGLSRREYDYFRPDEATPVKIKDIIQKCDIIYQRVGIVRNIIDLMGDFGSQGIRITHPNKRIEQFYQNWWKKVQGDFVSERFLNNFYRLATVIIKRRTAKLNKKDQKTLYKTIAEMEVTHIDFSKSEIPWKYVFLHPCTVEVVGGALASFVGKPMYALKLPEKLRRVISYPKTELERSLVAQLPMDIRQAASSASGILLPPDKTRVFHYKKDDWQEWAYPMTYAVMDDIAVLEKLKLADIAALDGAISNIRIFKLGSLEHKIMPTKAAAARLAEILQANVSAGTIDLVWGADIELLESKTSVHQFLGEAKYIPTLNNIYAGYGIPPTLTGTFGASGTTNNYISLKTLIQRLEYGRAALKAFWEHELVLVQKAMGFRFPAVVEFDKVNLSDEDAELALLIQLADRNLISDELLRTRFGHDAEIERIRINREHRERKNGKLVPKASPYHEAEFELALKKVFAQTGAITPSQAGLELPKPKAGEKPALEMRQPAGVNPGGAPKTSKKKSVTPGRPKNSGDTKKRATKTFKPKSKAVLEIWAKAAQEAIAEVVNPVVLEHFEKKNMRSLTTTEHSLAEEIKFGVLWNLVPLGEVSEATVLTALNSNDVPGAVNQKYKQYIKSIANEIDRQLTIDELKTIQAFLYAEFYGANDE